MPGWSRLVRDVTVFSGSAHPELAAEICNHLCDPDLPAHRVIISPSLRVRESTAPPCRHR